MLYSKCQHSRYVHDSVNLGQPCCAWIAWSDLHGLLAILLGTLIHWQDLFRRYAQAYKMDGTLWWKFRGHLSTNSSSVLARSQCCLSALLTSCWGALIICRVVCQLFVVHSSCCRSWAPGLAWGLSAQLGGVAGILIDPDPHEVSARVRFRTYIRTGCQHCVSALRCRDKKSIVFLSPLISHPQVKFWHTHDQVVKIMHIKLCAKIFISVRNNVINGITLWKSHLDHTKRWQGFSARWDEENNTKKRYKTCYGFRNRMRWKAKTLYLTWIF